MKNKKYLWLAGWLCAIPLSLAAQQTEPLTGKERLFNEGKTLFCDKTMLPQGKH